MRGVALNMPDDITVFTTITPSYSYSSELSLCLRLFKKALPEGSILILSDSKEPFGLRDSIVKHCSEGNQRYVVIAREPAMLMPRGTIERLIDVLESNPGIVCILPSEIKDRQDARYYTLRGFEKFVASIGSQTSAVIPYDGREPWLFVIRRDVLINLPIPENPMEVAKMLFHGTVGVSQYAYIHPFDSYYEEDRKDVLGYIPKAITSLLDVGCARGRFGEAVIREIGCRVVGIEMNSDEADKARSRLHRVIEGDFLKAEIDETFDCITCLDVIEHFTDTDAFLQRLGSLLRDGGYIFITIPNVGHWSIVEDLIAGRWDYVPAGIMTISHLRFFTKNTILSLLEDAGFTIMSVDEQSSTLEEDTEEVFGLLEKHNVELDRKSLSCLSYYILAKK